MLENQGSEILLFEHFYWLPPLVTAIVASLLAAYLYRRRSAPGAESLIALMTAVGIWSLGYSLEFASVGLADKTFWTRMEYLGVAWIAPAWLSFALGYTQSGWLRKRRSRFLLYLIPMAAIFGAMTNPQTHLLWTDVSLDNSGPIPLIIFQRTLFFWVYIIYSYLLILVGTLLMASKFLSAGNVYRKQLWIVMIGVAPPWLANVLYVTGLTPWPNLELTPFAFTASGLVLTVGLFRYQFMEIIPLARDAVMAGIQDAVFVLDINHRLVDLNKAAARMMNQSMESLIGRTADQFFTGQPGLMNRFQSNFEGRDEISFEKNLLELQASTLTDGAGRKIGRLLTLRDVTEHKKAIEEIRRSQRVLKAILESMPFALLVINPDKSIRQSNEAAWRLLKYDGARDLQGRNCHHAFCALDEGACPLFDQGLPVAAGEGVIVDRDGGRIPVLKSVIRIHLEDDDFSVEGYIDLTEQKRSEEERTRLESQLFKAKKMEALGTLASGISHDFNNILQIISGYIQILQKEGLETRENARYLEQADAAIIRASDLIRRLLSYSRPGEARRKPTRLNDIVEHTVNILSRTIPKMIRIELDLADNLWTIQAEDDQLESLLLNLASNSRDAMPEGGLLTISTRNILADEDGALDLARGPHVLLSVSDMGAGMDQETQDRMFEPFFTTKTAGQGTGLGMFTVYGIVQAHGGHIQCVSKPGQGTRFDVFLPVGEGRVHAVKDALTSPAGSLEGDGTVLVVDDETPIVEVARTALEIHGYQVLTASSGEEALSTYFDLGHKVDLVVLDLSMPGMGGRACLARLLEGDPGAKVVVASGYDLTNPDGDPTRDGAKEYLKKPYRLTDLLAAVRAGLDND